MSAVVGKPKEVVAQARETLVAFDRFLESFPAEAKIEFDTRHDFCPGVYARTIFMRAGVIYTSRIHKTKHFFFVAAGACTVIDSHGEKKLIVAPYMGVTTPGTKRALHIHEDCIWTTIHPTTLTDVDAIGREIMADSFEEFDEVKS